MLLTISVFASLDSIVRFPGRRMSVISGKKPDVQSHDRIFFNPFREEGLGRGRAGEIGLPFVKVEVAGSNPARRASR